MSKLSDFVGGSGGLKPFLDLGTVTGTQVLDLSAYSAFKVVQGAGNLTLDFVTDNPELRGEADLFLENNDSFSLTVNADNLNSFSTDIGLSAASYDRVSFSVSGQDTTPYDIAFNSSGTKMYMVGNNSDSVYQYSLSTAFDLSTASYDSVSFSVSGQDPDPRGIAFNSSGTKMYMVGSTSDSVHQYSLSTAFDLSTASYDSVSFSVSGQDTTPYDIAFNSSGTKMYMVGNTSDSVHQYSLSTAFDLSTASYDSVSFSVSGQDTIPLGIAFNSSGTKMYMVGNTSDSVHQYSLSTAFDLSTASYDSVSFDVSGQDTTPVGIAFNSSGTKMYMVGSTSDSVYQYSLASVNRVSQFGDFIGIQSEGYQYAI